MQKMNKIYDNKKLMGNLHLLLIKLQINNNNIWNILKTWIWIIYKKQILIFKMLIIK